MHEGGFDLNKSRFSETYAHHPPFFIWMVEIYEFHFTVAGELCQETRAQTSVIKKDLQYRIRFQGANLLWSGFIGNGIMFWTDHMERCFHLCNIIQLCLGLLTNLSLRPKIKCLSWKDITKITKILLTKILIQLPLKMYNPKALLMHTTVSLPPFISSFLPLPSVCLLFSSALPIPPGCSLALRCLPLILHPTIQEMPRAVSNSSSQSFSSTLPLYTLDTILLRYNFFNEITSKFLLAFSFKHNFFLLHCFVLYTGGKLSKHLIFYNHHSLNPYHSRL